jgi:hypothetical protein
MSDEYPKYYNDGNVRVDADGKLSFKNMQAAQEYFSAPEKYYENIMKDDNDDTR